MVLSLSVKLYGLVATGILAQVTGPLALMSRVLIEAAMSKEMRRFSTRLQRYQPQFISTP
jgi:hypothetical protein